MMRKLTFSLGIAVPAMIATGAVADGNLDTAPVLLADVGAWAQPLSDQEMGELRGGFAGFAFNVIMSGNLAQLTDTGGVTGAPPPNITSGNGTVNIQTAIGSFNGASGVFQIANLENSSFNVVNQNLFVQVAIIDVANSASIPTIQSLLDGTFAH